MITSVNNDRVKQVRALQSRRHARRKSGQCVIEGHRLVADAANINHPVNEVFYTESYLEAQGSEVLDMLSQRGAIITAVDEAVMEAMSDTQTPQGILALLPTPSLEIPEEFTFALVIDGISDPGNMGTIMRTAAAAGVELMIITSGTVDLTNPKVIRSAMGAHFRLPVQHLSWPGVANRLSEHVIFLAGIGSGADYYRVDWTQRSALIVSDEAHGPSDDALQLAHAHVTIPMPGGMESLNVAMAAGIFIYEMLRQRSTSLE